MAMNISKASVHDVHFLETFKQSGMNHAMLLGIKDIYQKLISWIYLKLVT